jgi:saccharopine dehydrogenase (NAD+, L-lysine forming)
VSQKPDRTINVATPLLNIPTMQRCLHHNSNYMDLASNIQPENIRSGQLEQLTLHEAFKQAGLLAVINAGISPGISELLTGYGIARHRLIPRSYRLLLRENFVAEVPLYSRSPSVAIDEMLTPAFMIEDGNPRIQEAFTTYHDPYVGKTYYFITQEESFGMYSHYKDTLSSLILATGGAEVEAIKALYMIGLLSTEPVGDTTYLQIVKDKMPRAASRQEVISAIQNHHLEDARFDFILEVSDAAHVYRATMHFNTEAFAALA